jgi:DNA mismatch repair protein MutL
LLSRLKQIYPSSWSENYLFIEHNDGIYSVNAIIGKSILKFNSSNNINIFVNQRPVKDKIIQKAIMQAYSRWLEPGMYPFVVLFLDIKPDLVDVNVHPRKEEVKFIDPGSVYNLILNLIKSKIEEKHSNLEQKSNYVDFSKSFQNKKNNSINWDKIKEFSEQSKKLDLSYEQNIFSQDIIEEKVEDIQII